MRNRLTDLLEIYARHGDAVAFVERRGLRAVRWSYRQVVETAYRVAHELAARGIGKGDRVLLWAANSAEWSIVFWGCCLRGAVLVPLDVSSTRDFVTRVRDQTQAKLLVHGDEIRPLPSLLAFSLGELIEQSARHPAESPVSEESAADDAVEIIYTSGTTNEPRGVCLTHRNLLANITPIEREVQKYLRWERLVHPIRFLNLVPLSHIFGQFMGLFIPPLIGGETIFQHSLNPSEIVATTKRERVSVIVAVPRSLDSLREHVINDWATRGELEERRELLSKAKAFSIARRMLCFRDVHRRFGWKFWAFVVGGATLAEETEIFWRRLGFAVIQGYGMTETAALIALNHPLKSKSGTVGRALPSNEVKLAENGEILVRGDAVARGYWTGKLEPVTDDQGWLHTGDLGELDAEGNIRFKGRRKDVIVTSSGVNIYPEDLEAVLRRQPEVRDACVVRIEDERGGEEPLAVLLLEGGPREAKRAIERANELLASPQQIRRWAIWPEPDFPRTPTQKIKKREVLARLGLPSSTTADRGDLLNDLIAQLTGIESGLRPEMKLSTDLALDSLGRIELLSALENRLQVHFDEAAITEETTIGDLERMARALSPTRSPQYPYADWPRRFPFTWLRIIFFYALMLPLVRLLARARFYGTERLRDLTGPALFVANHVTMVDHALILAALPARLRHRLAIAMDGELLREWRWPEKTLGWLTRLRLLGQYFLVAALFNVFPLPQRGGFRRSFAIAGELVDRGWSLLVFPEGRRTETGEMDRFRQGAGLLATQLDIPIIPVKLLGLFELKKQRRFSAPPGHIRVVLGAPLRFARNSDPAQATQELEDRVKRLEAERQSDS
ncbi:AMP-binding protein [Pyrinomonas methylaliphatogenes]|uniref:AMP-forming long-chain acyl-CoA synthetase n=1 Tax=Pyrinomonas methylaliphatogenes TaxID=454194 RepID=A0A0B6WZM4_9BACT|nr:AMP-binding protein [Pyrinomonas methylaliphatogenes]CDM66162.1 AMP-forming long-chain acyl-CoA synthetase [Pyrinomonas methylaliphatogenes]